MADATPIAFIISAVICFLFVMSGVELVQNTVKLVAPEFLVTAISSLPQSSQGGSSRRQVGISGPFAIPYCGSRRRYQLVVSCRSIRGTTSVAISSICRGSSPRGQSCTHSHPARA